MHSSKFCQRAVALAGALLINIGVAQAAEVNIIVQQADRPQLQQAAISSQFKHDYPGYTWLTVDETALRKLQALQVPFQRANDSKIQFLNWRFDPLSSPPAELNQSTPKNAQGQQLSLVQLRAPATDQWLAQLTQNGMRIVQYYPHNSYLTWSSQAALQQVRALPQVRWAGGFSAPLKVSPQLARMSGQIDNVYVHFVNSGNPNGVLNALEAAGGEILNVFPAQPDRQLYDAIVRAPRSQVERFAAIAEVVWLGYSNPVPGLDDESSSQTVAGNFLPSGQPELNYPGWLTSVGLDGSGVVWAVTDTGVDYTHPDLNTRIVGGFDYPGCAQANPGDDPNSGGHGTHVAGILGGDASAGFTDSDGYLYGLGVAPGVSFYAQNPICGSQNSWPPAGGWQVLSQNPVQNNAVGTSNSWTSGEGTAHGYQATERTHDLMVRDGDFGTANIAEPFMIVFSAGNSGPGANTLTSPKEAKNVVVTAGTRTWRVSNDIDAMYNSSSRGPAVDGRFVPTIAAPGQQVGSTRNDGASQCATAIGGTNGLYSFCTGTSMAAPHTSGSLALITEWWRNNNGGANPSPAMGKALLINTATDISGAPAIPNFDEGWGRITLRNLFQPTTPFEFWDQQDLLSDSGSEWNVTVGVPDTSQPLKITLVWSDAPGAVGANPALVNDLNLVVENGGNSYLGNVFSNGMSTTGGSADALNNMENVFIDAPGGSATIRVQGLIIAGDGVPYNGDVSDQDFALVCSNCALQPTYTLDVTNPAAQVCAPDNAQYTIEVGSILNFMDPVTLNLSGNPAGTTANFSPNPVTPLNNSTLTISNTGSATPGSYSLQLGASASSGAQSRTLSLGVFDQTPASATLSAPANGAMNQTLSPTLTWTAVAQAGGYIVELDDDPGFGSIDFTTTTDQTSADVDVVLSSNTQYYWRVTTDNACGSNVSTTFNFITAPLPGDCPLNVQAESLFFDDMDSGAAGWTHDGTQDTWQLSSDNVWSGTSAWYAEDLASISDQRLVSPAVTLPTTGSPVTLQYYNHQTIERQNATNCWDGAILEITTNGGASWTQIDDAQLLTDPYSGTINDFTGGPNPLANLRGWCGDPQDWTRSVVDLQPWLGETVQFRFRLGTDGTVGRVDGWKIDDFSIQACSGGSETILADGFEEPLPPPAPQQ
ncbi:MAG: hypothetical protein Tsb002_09190 [Wenzhouxiangellaceae bacterium]